MLNLLDANGPATVVRRTDYTPPAFWIDTVALTFDLDPSKTRVLNKMTLRRNLEVPAQALRLDGDELNLARVLVNGAGCSFKMDGKQLVLDNLPAEGSFELEIFTTPARRSKTPPSRACMSAMTHFLPSARRRGSGASPTFWIALT